MLHCKPWTPEPCHDLSPRSNLKRLMYASTPGVCAVAALRHMPWVSSTCTDQAQLNILRFEALSMYTAETYTKGGGSK
jgi:hypothetical protein